MRFTLATSQLSILVVIMDLFCTGAKPTLFQVIRYKGMGLLWACPHQLRRCAACRMLVWRGIACRIKLEVPRSARG